MPSRNARPSGWLSDPDAVRPTVLIIGGFLTVPAMYLRLRRRLLDRGAAEVLIADVYTPDWLLAVGRGGGAVATRALRALIRAIHASASSSSSQGAPLLVVGHSAGGMVARLLTTSEPFAGRRLGASDAVGGIVTLGSPHRTGRVGDLGRRLGVAVGQFADRVVPGAFYAPRVGYVAVAGRAIPGARSGIGRSRVAQRFYDGLLPNADGATAEGDGLVPVGAALLEGARHVAIDGVTHGQLSGRPWYGSPQAVDVWWPIAVETWHEALRVRAVPRGSGGASGARHGPVRLTGDVTYR